MRKLFQRILGAGAAVAVLAGSALPAYAEVLKQSSISTITTTEELKSSSTVYVGEVVVGGVSKIKYVYSSDLAHSKAAWDDLKNALGSMEDTDFASLFPAEFDDKTDEKGIKLCNVSSYAADMDESWTSASAVGENYYAPTYKVSAGSSENLYDADAGFKAKLDALKAARVEAIDEPVDNSKTIISALDSRTLTDVYYTIVDGQVVRHYDTNVLYDSEEITVIYTKAEMKINSNTIVNVTGKQGKVVKDSTVYVGEVVVDGEAKIKYLWSENMTRAETVAAALKTGLTGLDDKDFAALVPVIIGEEDAKGLAECNIADYESKMNSSWKNAESVAALYYPDMTVSTSSSADLYEADENFAKACKFEDNAELVDTAGKFYKTHSPLGKLSAANTDSVTYTVENGQLVKYIDRFIDYTLEAVTVIYTKAELTSSSEDKVIDSVSVDVESPKPGTVIEGDVTKPLLSIPSDANYYISWTMYINNYPSADENYDDGSVSGTTMEEGKEYFFEVYLTPKEGYTFADGDKVTLKVNGGDEFELGYCSENQFAFFSKVKAANAPAPVADPDPEPAPATDPETPPPASNDPAPAANDPAPSGGDNSPATGAAAASGVTVLITAAAVMAARRRK